MAPGETPVAAATRAAICCAINLTGEIVVNLSSSHRNERPPARPWLTDAGRYRLDSTSPTRSGDTSRTSGSFSAQTFIKKVQQDQTNQRILPGRPDVSTRYLALMLVSGEDGIMVVLLSGAPEPVQQWL